MLDNILDPKSEVGRQWLDDFQKRGFTLATLSPLSWSSCAWRHKRAADILYEIAHAADDRVTSRMRKTIKEGTFTDGVRTLEGEELEDHWNQELLWEYFLLVGYALECVTKGCLVATHAEPLKEGKKGTHLNPAIAKHDLNELYHDCGIPVSDEEAQLLTILSRAVESGKYPSPKKLEDWPRWGDPDDNNTIACRLSNPHHNRQMKSLIDDLYARAVEQLGKEEQKKRGAAAS